MKLLYADTSALLRAYLHDEPDHVHLRALILETGEAIVTSELARIEFASAVCTAGRAGRTGEGERLLDRFDADCRSDGPIRLVTLMPAVVMPSALRLVLDHGVRTLDAIHLAVALEQRDELAELAEVAFVTRAARQARAAAALGFEVG